MLEVALRVEHLAGADEVAIAAARAARAVGDEDQVVLSGAERPLCRVGNVQHIEHRAAVKAEVWNDMDAVPRVA